MSPEAIQVFLHNLFKNVLPHPTTNVAEGTIAHVERGDVVLSTATQPASDLAGIRKAIETFHTTAMGILSEAEALRECHKTVIFSRAVGNPILQFGTCLPGGGYMFAVKENPTLEDLLGADALLLAPRDTVYTADPDQFATSENVHIVCNSSHPTRPLQMLFRHSKDGSEGHYYHFLGQTSIHKCHQLSKVDTLEMA